jgi:hypothetical protein
MRNNNHTSFTFLCDRLSLLLLLQELLPDLILSSIPLRSCRDSSSGEIYLVSLLLLWLFGWLHQKIKMIVERS